MTFYEYMELEKTNPGTLRTQRERERRLRRREEQRRQRRQRFLIGGVAFLLGGAVVWSAGAAERRMEKNETQIQARQEADEQDNASGSGAGNSGQSGDEAAQDDAKDSGLSGYETAYDSLLVLVNKDHSLPQDYEVSLTWLQNKSCAVSAQMYDALRDMLTDGSTDGREFVVASGYRDASYQQSLLDEDVQASMESEGLTYEQAYEKETRETMPPGYSEHETGLAVDIVALDYQVLDGRQEDTPENEWLQEHCSEYGFILRYPRGKEEITGIDYEAWHFRYVGTEAAQEITDRGITLEEYLGEA